MASFVLQSIKLTYTGWYKSTPSAHRARVVSLANSDIKGVIEVIGNIQPIAPYTGVGSIGA